MRTWKFQLAVAVMAGLFAGQTAMAATFLSLTSTPSEVVEGFFETQVYGLIVDPDGAPGSATIEPVGSPFIGPEEIVAITANPDAGLEFFALTAGGVVGQVKFFVPEDDVDPFAFFFDPAISGETLPGTFGVGGAIVFDSENGILLINNVGDQTLTAYDPFATSGAILNTAPYTIGGFASTVGSIADREIIALGESSVIALGDTNDDHLDDSGFGLYDVISAPNDDLFADITALDNNLYPESLDGFLGTGSVYNLQHFTDGTSRLSFIADVHPVTRPLSRADVRDITNLFKDPTVLDDLRGLARIDLVDDVNPVPEPVTGVLGLLGLAALGAATRRRVA